MSTIRKRGCGWQADFVLNGTRVRRSFRTRDAALDAVLEADAPSAATPNTRERRVVDLGRALTIRALDGAPFLALPQYPRAR